ncbi:MAG TPA: FixH family protein [Pyrinomonadaceae bacterium]|nr:FixH family protein [Pyrinomonadaceae bacterium]
MIVKYYFPIALCLCILGAYGCRRNEAPPDLKLTHEVSPQPPRVGYVTVNLGLTDSSGNPISRAGLSLEGYMSHSGMPPVSGRVAEVRPGSYIGNMELSMAGDWVVIVHIHLPGQVSVDRQFEIKGVLPE